MGCWNNIIGAQFSRPLMGIVYNGITAAYLLSQRIHSFPEDEWNDAMRLLTGTNYYKADSEYGILSLDDRMKLHYGEVRRDGRALISHLFPPDFYYHKGDVLIVDGIFVRGVLKAAHVGPVTDSIIHALHHRYSKRHAARFITEAQYVFVWHMEIQGFSVGYADCSPVGEVQEQVSDIVRIEMAKAQAEISSIDVDMDKEMSQLYYEEAVRAALGNIREIGNRIVTTALSSSNPLRVMADSGAKGSNINVAQITGIIGQQFIKGKRPDLAMNPDPVTGRYRRFLPYYDIDDNDITTRGFVDKSFDQGMDPGHMVAHMMASRIGIIDTALGTAKTGHLHRTVNKTMEDVRIGYNGSVCNGIGVVFNFISTDGYDAIALVPASSPATGTISSPLNFASLVEKINATAIVENW